MGMLTIFILLFSSMGMESGNNNYVPQTEIRQMSVEITVTNLEELMVAINAATGGETILLQPGNYGDLEIRSLNFTVPITIKSSIPSDQATIDSILFLDSSGVIINDVFLDFPITETTQGHDGAIRILGSSNISITDSIIEGGLAIAGSDPDADPGMQLEEIIGYPVSRAFQIQSSQGITITGNDISLFEKGIVLFSVEGLTISGNEIHHLRNSPLVGSDLQDVLVDGNYFHSSTPWKFGGAGDHGDYIYFWTDVNQDTPNSDITITNNFLSQGDGTSMLGIIISDETEAGVQNVVIEGNVIQMNHSSAISVNHVDNLTISSNTLVQSNIGEGSVPTIRILSDNTNVTVENNITPSLIIDSAIESSVLQNNNLIVQSDDFRLDNYLTNVLINPNVDPEFASLEDFALRPDTIFSNVGAIEFDLTPSSIQATIVAATEIGTPNSLTATFSGSFSADETGLLDSSEAQFSWDFGDGTTGVGIVVEHTYAQEGDYTAVLSVTRNGVSDTTEYTLGVSDPHVLDIPNAGVLDSLSLLSSMSATDNTLVFDGTDYLNLGRPDNLFNLEQLYLSFDIKPTEQQTGARVFWSHSRYTVELNGDSLTFTVYTDNGVANKLTTQYPDIYDGDFHNVAMSFDSETGTITAFIDNIEAGSLSGVVGHIAGVGSWDVSVGGTVWGNYFNGEIDNVSIWTAPEPVVVPTVPITTSTDTTPTTEPVLDTTTFVEPVVTTDTTEPVVTTTYTNSSITTATTEDVSIATTEPTLDTTTFEEPIIAYETNMFLSIAGGADAGDYTAVGNSVIGTDALIFNGKGYVDLKQDGDLFGLDAFTLSFDITASTGKNDNKGVVRLAWNKEQYGIEMDGEDAIFRIQTDTGDTQVLTASGVGLNDGASHNIVMSYDSALGVLSAYVDNALVAEASGITGSLAEASGSGVTIGGGDRGRNFEGEIDNFTMWSDADHTPDATYSSASLTVLDTSTDTNTTTTTDSTDPSLTTTTTSTTDDGIYNPDDYYDSSIVSNPLV